MTDRKNKQNKQARYSYYSPCFIQLNVVTYKDRVCLKPYNISSKLLSCHHLFPNFELSSGFITKHPEIITQVRILGWMVLSLWLFTCYQWRVNTNSLKYIMKKKYFHVMKFPLKNVGNLKIAKRSQLSHQKIRGVMKTPGKWTSAASTTSTMQKTAGW